MVPDYCLGYMGVRFVGIAPIFFQSAVYLSTFRWAFLEIVMGWAFTFSTKSRG
jgi:hypothetical protein